MSDKHLLEVDGLTVRFGGLTAVGDVSFHVDRGEIVSVIGPNGAGKTTVFNAITGIYEPTEGSVRLDGRELTETVTPKRIVSWGLVGLSVGLFALLFTANIDMLWAATVKQHYQLVPPGADGVQTDERVFDVAAARAAFVAHLLAEPRVEAALGRFRVVSADGKTVFARAGTVKGIEKKRASVQELLDTAHAKTPTLVEGKWVVPSSFGVPLVNADTEAEALAQLEVFRTGATARSRARQTRLVVFVVATLLGVLGAAAIFRQSRRTPSVIAERGIARTFQNIRLFPDMSVRENVLAGMHQHLGPTPRHGLVAIAAPLLLTILLAAQAVGVRLGWFTPAGGAGLVVVGLVLLVAWLVGLVVVRAFSPHGARAEVAAAAEADQLLAFVGLDGAADEVSRNLSYGNQRRLEIARALATRPTLLLLDEPAAGMNPAETVSLMALIRAIRDRGITVVLIEHHMRVVMGISDRITVLEYGRKIAEGTPEEVRANPRVIEAYLGKEELGLMLHVDAVTAGYGAISVLKSITLEVAEGEIVTLIGGNGAGKTTTLNVICGVVPVRSGKVVFGGQVLNGRSPNAIVRLGMAHSPEGRKIFPRMTVLENLEMGAFTRDDKAGIASDLERSFALFPILGERKHQLGGTLSGGEQQMLAVARALMSRPKLLLLDEPSLGLAPLIVARIFEVVKELNRGGVTVLLVEQNARTALRLAHRGYVIETGEITMEGPAQALLADERVQKAYLGE